MGQYYRGVVLGKTTKKSNKIIVKKAFCPYAHDNGAKLMEHSYVGNWYVSEYVHALANQFFGFPFVWAGDYADDKYDTCVYCEACNFINAQEEKNAKALGYKKVDQGWGKDYLKGGEYLSGKDFSPSTPYDKLIESIKDYTHIINFDKKQYVRIPKKEKEKDENGYYILLIHPLPLLCADGNGRGGGDYWEKHPNFDKVGIWAYDRIGIGTEKDVPADFTELQVTFSEN